MNEAEQRLDSLCSRIIESDNGIRFVGISNKMGNQIISRYRRGLTPLLTPKEIEMYALQSVLRMNTRKDYESKLGKPIYSFTLYQKLKRVTINLEDKEYPVLLASFDIEADHENIIVNKILPMINEEGLRLFCEGFVYHWKLLVPLYDQALETKKSGG
jgi:hypothetical protein